MADMIVGGPIAKYDTGFTNAQKFQYAAYADQAHVWLNEMQLGQLNTEGIKQRVWASADNQNTYLETLEFRLRDIEDDEPSRVNAEKAYQLGREIYEVRAMGDDVPWLQAFNDQLSHYGQRAAAGEEYNFGAP